MFQLEGVWERDFPSTGGESGNETMHMYAASNCESVNTHSQENT